MFNEQRFFLLMFGLLGINIWICAAMQPTKYLEHPQEYENFRFTRPYGAFKCNAVGLTNDVFNNHIAPCLRLILAKNISTKFKHRFLSGKWDLECFEKSSFQEIPRLFLNIWKSFEYHDGTYVLVPDVADYATWDGDTGIRLTTELKVDDGSVKLSVQAIHKSIIHLCSPEQKCDKNMLYVHHEQGVESVSFSEKITFPLMSSDGNWFCVWPKSNARKLWFFGTQTMKLQQECSFAGIIMAVCWAHHAPLVAVSTSDRVMLINPGTTDSLLGFKKKYFPVHSMQFTPDDACLCIQGDSKICIYDVKSGSGVKNIDFRDITRVIQKISISPDGDTMAIAFARGRLKLMNNLSQLESLQPICDGARWRYFNVERDNDNAKPVILWNNNDDLLFTLNPSSQAHQDGPISLVIRKSTNGRFLTEHRFWPNNPIAMGLTQNGQSLVFVYRGKEVSQINLYDRVDLEDIDFITKKANWYQLFCLSQAYKKSRIKDLDDYKCHKNAKKVVEAMRSLIAEYRKSI